ncbi:serine hydrolase domain-containing protein [Thiofilum flexile]|uniref:serine hydrolase domain-containing protein n=1 Tax=Thiofilum flexile TaxID=125627 RepID=UPI00036ED3AA|nr:serine hydrolase domain-containing protein [Thiofilum flexile]
MRLAQAVDEVIEQALAEQRIVGTVVLVAHQGITTYARAAGWADREAQTPTYLDTIFRWASLTKPVVSVAAMCLIAEGKLQLDDSVTDYLPAFRPRLADGSTPVITIRHLLTHTAGLGYRFMQKEGDYHTYQVSDGLDNSGLTLAQNIAAISQTQLFSPPGTAWRYSVATDVLGHVLEQITGKPLQTIIAERITDPLKMSDSAFYIAPNKAARVASAYADGKPTPTKMGVEHRLPFANLGEVVYSPARVFNPQAFAGGGGGMSGTASDLLKLLETIRTGGGKLLPLEYAQALLQNQIGDLYVNMKGAGWGFSFMGAVVTDPSQANTTLSKGSVRWGGVYGNAWFIDPSRELSVVALTNTSVEGTSGLFPQQLTDAITGAVA